LIRRLGRVWVPTVMVVVVALAAFTVSNLHKIFGSHMYHPDSANADAIVQFNPKRVLYEIFGPAGTVADINYLDAEAQPQRVDAATLPWSLMLVTTLTAVSANVVAQGDSDTIGCRITVNGDVRDEHTVDAYNAQTSCLVKSA
jgi:Mycobacterium membrane protein